MSKFSALRLWHYKANGHITGRATQGFKPSVKATSNCLAKRSQFAIEKTLFAWRLHRSKVVVLDGGNLPVAGSKHVPPPEKRQFLRGSNTYCNMAINSTNYSHMMHNVFLLVIYIYIVCFCCCCCFLPWRNKICQKEWRDRMDLRGIDSNAKLHVLLKIKHGFWNDFRWIVYNQQETNSPIVLTRYVSFLYVFTFQ